ncbi:hypothetical protein GWN26_10205, partial [Candidatus Saccharibacteria bacterium]|nr:hypothetical protein [Candidatus Saccharibacteria bacterium]
MIGSALLISILSIIGSQQSKNILISEFVSSRYFYAPGILITLALILIISSHWEKNHFAGVACLLIVWWVLAAGIVKGAAAAPHWTVPQPPWSQEVKKFQGGLKSFIQTSPPRWGIGYQHLIFNYSKSTPYAPPPLVLAANKKISQRFTCNIGSFDDLFVTV